MELESEILSAYREALRVARDDKKDVYIYISVLGAMRDEPLITIGSLVNTPTGMVPARERE